MRTVLASGSFLLLVTLAATSNAQEARIGEVKLRVNCISEGTTWDNARRHCSDGGEYSAPEGFVLDQNSIRKVENSGNGSVYWCNHEFSDFRQIMPGFPITQPANIVVSGYALSPERSPNARGWIDCDFSVMQVDIPQMPPRQDMLSALEAAEEAFAAFESETPPEDYLTPLDAMTQTEWGEAEVEFRAFNLQQTSVE